MGVWMGFVCVKCVCSHGYDYAQQSFSRYHCHAISPPPPPPLPPPQVKKLVYVYLVRYAEEQQDLALLSISTFQKGLKDPNQLIRAGALRVLSSIRVPIIAPIMMLAIKDVSV